MGLCLLPRLADVIRRCQRRFDIQARELIRWSIFLSVGYQRPDPISGLAVRFVNNPRVARICITRLHPEVLQALIPRSPPACEKARQVDEACAVKMAG